MMYYTIFSAVSDHCLFVCLRARFCAGLLRKHQLEGEGNECPALAYFRRECKVQLSGVHKGGFSKGGFSNNDMMITHKLLNPPLLNSPFVNSRSNVPNSGRAAGLHVGARRARQRCESRAQLFVYLSLSLSLYIYIYI